MYSSNILKHVTFVQNKIQSTDILLFYYSAQDSKLHYFHMMNVIIKQLYWAIIMHVSAADSFIIHIHYMI